MGNLDSILNMHKKIGAPDAKISSEAKDIEQADKLILPGVGAFDTGMQNLRDTGLLQILNEKVLEQKNLTWAFSWACKCSPREGRKVNCRGWGGLMALASLVAKVQLLSTNVKLTEFYPSQYLP
jgi:hypothetical protein